MLGPAGPAKLDDTTECLAVPRAAVGRVIGKGGSMIKLLQQDYRCNIQIPKEADAVEVCVGRLLAAGAAR